MKIDREKLHQEMLDDVAASKKAIFDLVEHNELLDEDGYPTEAALDAIRLWHFTDAKGWFKFIEGLWAYRNWGWTEYDEPHEWQDVKQYKDAIVHRYEISTAGWSGNESIIRAMKDNQHMLWHLNWVQSRRGGHYIFELKEFEDD